RSATDRLDRCGARAADARAPASLAGTRAVQVEDIALRVLAELKPNRAIKTNVEYYAAAVLQGVGLPPDVFPATFALARHAGWTAHCIEQAQANVLIRPSVHYVGPEERSLPI
ncbi:MAG TPA: citrate/2-methylcitrate synthase, partial [Candidatus Limnocylindrales bacterium]|nr:citrate/2-methylcitrate synthase [Candidatus Limnocylindrales bacterium]